MVAAERAFAAHAAQDGIRAAFLAYLADGAIMFAPDPVDGRAFFSARPASDARLIWYPSHAGISAAGDLGYTAGPSEYRAAPDASVSHGHFASVWRRGPDGGWKVVVDLGTPHPKPRGAPALFDPRRGRVSQRGAPAVASLTEDEVGRTRASLLALDSAFARTAAARGTREAMDQFADEFIRLHRPGAFPITGRRRAVAAAGRERDTPTWEPRDGGAALSGDLGYTWGAVSWNDSAPAAPQAYYLRVWRKGKDGWRLVLEAVAPREG
jgi:ketosteroid isomerase-like protein